jgi:alginate biosynthesis protein Alg44
MLDVLKGHLDDDQLQPAKVEELFGKQMTGTLTSPCDCTVAQQLVADGQYASKGDVIFQLVPRNTRPPSKRASPIASSATCARHPGELPGRRRRQTRTGKIVSSTSLKSADLSSDIRVQIQPDEPLDSTFAGRPVEVNSDRGPNLNWLIDKAMAAGL